MFDQVIQEIIDEVALEGNQGCTIDQLFTFAENLIIKSIKHVNVNTPIRFDDNYKAYLWNHLRNNYELVFTEKGTVIDPTNLSFQDMKLKGIELMVKSTEEARDRNIYGSLKSEKKNLKDNHKLVLELIAKSRFQGIAQFRLGELLNMDPKTIFYYIKKLDQLGFVIKETAYASNINTRIIFLKKFAPQNEKKDSNDGDDGTGDLYRVVTFKTDLIKVLSEAENNMMTLQSAIEAMGFVTVRNIRWARVKISQLHDQGVVEKFVAFDGVKQKPSVRLVKLSDADAVNAITEKAVEDHIEEKKYLDHFYRDIPSEYQFYQDIVESGEKGLVRQDLMDKYPQFDESYFKAFFENAASKPKTQEYVQYMIYRTEELSGKNRLFRYFALEGWRKYNENLGKTVEEPQVEQKTRSLALEEPKSIDHIAKAFGIVPSTKPPIKRLRATQNPLDDEDNMPKTRQKRAKKPASTDETQTMDLDPTPPVSFENVKRVARTRSGTNQSTAEASTSTNKRKLGEISADDDAYTEQLQLSNKSGVLIQLKVTTPSELKPKTNRNRTTILNSTRMRRCAILLDMMEEQHVRELGKETITEFNKIEMATEGGQHMAETTFKGMAKQLHEEKKLKLFVSTIQKSLGLTEIKTFILHSCLTEDSDQVKQFIDSYRIEKPMMAARKQHREYKMLDVEKLPSSPAQPSTNNEAMAVMSLRTEEFTQKCAFQYGWVRSRWHRARVLHESLIQYYIFSNAQDQMVDMTEYIKFISLDTLAKICFSLPYHDFEFRDYMDVEENRLTSLADLPQKIELTVFQNKARIRSIVIFLLRILESLHVIEVEQNVEPGNRYSIAPKYRISTEGVIRDYAFKGHSILNTLPLKSVEGVQHFWEELQSACTHPFRFRTEQDKKELEERADKNNPLNNIHIRRGWVVEVVLSSNQREILDSFINPGTRAIPTDDATLREHLVKETNLTSTRIRAYYTAAMGAIIKKESKEKKQKARLQKQLAMSADSTINHLMLVSQEKRKIDGAILKLKQEGPFVQPTYVGSRKFRRLRVRVEPYQGQDIIRDKRTSRKLHNFDQLERDMILYSYCIMKARSKGRLFFWRPITQLLSNRKADTCRRQFIRMVSQEPDLALTVERLKGQWEKYYKEGIERQEIQDEKPWDTLDFDLCSYVEYFITRMQEKQSNEYLHAECLLPLNYNNIREKCLVIRDEQHIIHITNYTNGQSISTSVFNEDIYDTPAIVTEVESSEISVHLVKTLIKMLLMTPDDLYCSQVAFNLLKKYRNNIVERALDDLRTEGLLVKNKSKYGNRIPGKGFNVSEKFLAISSGTLPFGLIDDARLHYATIATNETVSLKGLELNGGIAASTLDLLAQGKISLYMENRDTYLMARHSLYYPKASAASLRRAYIYNGLDIAIKKNDLVSSIKDSNISRSHDDGKIILPTPEEIKMYLQELNASNTLIEIVYGAVASFKEAGTSLDFIIMSVNNSKRNLFAEDIISNAVKLLVNHEPPIIREVGFKQFRYVASEFCSNWLLKSDDDKISLNPLMWYDVSGKVIQSALDGCAKAVISHILDQPGISHANLRKKFDGFFTEYELLTLMKYLIDSKAVISKKIQRGSRPKRISIFEKRPLSSTSKNNGLTNCNEITHYWLSSDYYLF